jgi:hypothetical protein
MSTFRCHRRHCRHIDSAFDCSGAGWQYESAQMTRGSRNMAEDEIPEHAKKAMQRVRTIKLPYNLEIEDLGPEGLKDFFHFEEKS